MTMYFYLGFINKHTEEKRDVNRNEDGVIRSGMNKFYGLK